jgi:hypothetical protein
LNPPKNVWSGQLSNWVKISAKFENWDIFFSTIFCGLLNFDVQKKKILSYFTHFTSLKTHKKYKNCILNVKIQSTGKCHSIRSQSVRLWKNLVFLHKNSEKKNIGGVYKHFFPFVFSSTWYFCIKVRRKKFLVVFTGMFFVIKDFKSPLPSNS